MRGPRRAPRLRDGADPPPQGRAEGGRPAGAGALLRGAAAGAGQGFYLIITLSRNSGIIR